MADTEKITINMSVVDLGQIDLLVDQGFYSSRTDFIRTAIRKQLSGHEAVVQDTIVRRASAVGAFEYSRNDLEKMKAKGEQVEIKCVGLVVLSNDITPELAREVIKSIKIYGVLRASEPVKSALADRIS
jgi:Arc/MetJ-type ribon-helix-helix transcriptional regulator